MFINENNRNFYVQFLVSSGAPLGWSSIKGDTCLHVAVEGGRLAILRFLLEVGAPVDVINIRGSTAFLESVIRNRFEECYTLIDYGTDVNVTNRAGLSALYIATFRLNKAFTQLLVEAGAELRLERWLRLPAFPPVAFTPAQRATYTQLRALAVGPPPLLHLCHCIIRHHLHTPKGTYAMHLPLPAALRDRLALKHVTSHSHCAATQEYILSATEGYRWD